MLVKEGAAGVRFYERSNGKQRLIFLQNDELAWLVKIVEELVAVESSEVFWDQSRAGYPRIIVQRRSNRHGCFLTVEEFDGRRRYGNILIPKGRYGRDDADFHAQQKALLGANLQLLNVDRKSVV